MEKIDVYNILKFNHSDIFGGIYVKLNPEEKEAILKFREGIEEKITISTPITSKDMSALGFIDPSRIPAYECPTCSKMYAESPKVEVEIHDRFSIIANYKLAVDILYYCNHCEENTPVYGGKSNKPELIPSEFIILDETAQFKDPTEKGIEDLFTKIEKQAEEGQGTSIEKPNYSKKLKILSRWCEKINYTLIPERLNSLEQTFKTKYIANVRNSLPEAVSAIKQQSIILDCAASIDDEVNHISESGLYDYLDTINKAIELSIIPEDKELKIDILKILLLCNNIPAQRIGLYQEKKQEIDKMIEKEQNHADSLVERINKFLNRAGLEFEDMEKANLIECLNPNKKAWKFYMITELGKEVWKFGKKLKEEVKKRR